MKQFLQMLCILTALDLCNFQQYCIVLNRVKESSRRGDVTGHGKGGRWVVKGGCPHPLRAAARRLFQQQDWIWTAQSVPERHAWKAHISDKSITDRETLADLGRGALGANAPPAVSEIGGNLHISWNIKKSEQLLCRQVCFKTFNDTQGSKIRRVFRRRRFFFEGFAPPPAASETYFLDPPVQGGTQEGKGRTEAYGPPRTGRIKVLNGRGSKSRDHWDLRLRGPAWWVNS